MQSCARREALARLMEVMDDIDLMGDPILKSNAIKKLDWADINVQTRFGVKSSPGAPGDGPVQTYWYWRSAWTTRVGEPREGDWKRAASKKAAMQLAGRFGDGQMAPYDAEPEQSKESAAAQVQALLPPHPLIFCYNVLLWPSAQCCYT